MPPILLALRTMGSGRGFGCSAVRPNLDRNEWFDQGLSELILERLCSTMGEEAEGAPPSTVTMGTWHVVAILLLCSLQSPLLLELLHRLLILPSAPSLPSRTISLGTQPSITNVLRLQCRPGSTLLFTPASLSFLAFSGPYSIFKPSSLSYSPRSLADLGSTYTPSGPS